MNRFENSCLNGWRRSFWRWRLVQEGKLRCDVNKHFIWLNCELYIRKKLWFSEKVLLSELFLGCLAVKFLARSGSAGWSEFTWESAYECASSITASRVAIVPLLVPVRIVKKVPFAFQWLSGLAYSRTFSFSLKLTFWTPFRTSFKIFWTFDW
jgi:hypothetical protein